MVIKCQVRRNKVNNELELFYYDEYRDTVCFCFSEGHNNASHRYRLEDCKPAALDVQKEFINKVQKYYDSIPDDERVILKLVQKLNRP